MLEQVTKISISRDPEQSTAVEAGCKLEVREICETGGAAKPVLLLGKIVVANARPMQLAQHLLGGTEIRGITERFRQVQSHAIDECPNQHALSGPQQLRTNPQPTRQPQRAPPSREQMARRNVGPP